MDASTLFEQCRYGRYVCQFMSLFSTPVYEHILFTNYYFMLVLVIFAVKFYRWFKPRNRLAPELLV
jgi:hypothetical protein